jgi:hypothetical protein
MKRLLAACLLAGCAANAAAYTDVQWDRFQLAANGSAAMDMLRPRPAAVPAATPAAVPDAGAVPSACYDRARAEHAELTSFWAAQLCGGAASSDAPVDCYAQAKRGTDLTAFGRVNLCAGASSASAPVGCYLQSAQLGDLTGFGRVQLCSGAATAEGPVACYQAQSASHRELTAFTRVKLCARR